MKLNLLNLKQNDSISTKCLTYATSIPDAKVTCFVSLYELTTERCIEGTLVNRIRYPADTRNGCRGVQFCCNPPLIECKHNGPASGSGESYESGIENRIEGKLNGKRKQKFQKFKSNKTCFSFKKLKSTNKFIVFIVYSYADPFQASYVGQKMFKNA